jgi:hypothetical protein
MARLDIEVEHGQAPEAARANFETAIAAAEVPYGRRVRKLAWSPDRTAVDASGTGFDVRISYDDRKVYARGTIPMAANCVRVRSPRGLRITDRGEMLSGWRRDEDKSCGIDTTMSVGCMEHVIEEPWPPARPVR